MKQETHPEPGIDTNHFDAVIVGSGLGGLLSAVILAKEGMKVCVLEKNKQIGGCLQTFSLHKTVFDSCVHYIGGLGEGHTLNRIFSYAGIMDQLTLKTLNTNGFDRVAFGENETTYPQAIGFDNFVEQLAIYFPEARVALQNYIQKVCHVGDQFPLYRLRMGTADEKASVVGFGLTETIEQITTNPLLQNVLTGNNLLYAGQKGTSPFYLHALVLESYMHSAHKIVPGSSQIAKFLWKELQHHGGEVYRNCEVTRLVEEDGIMQYAEVKDGQRFYGKQFIANVHPQVVLELMQTRLIRPAYRNRIHQLQQTTSAFMLNIVLSPGKVGMKDHNLYWHKSQDSWRAPVYEVSEWPNSYALYFTESAHYPGYAESLSILTYMHFEEVRAWQDTHNHSGDQKERGNAYQEFKEERADKLLNLVMQRIPELRDHIIAHSAATPLTYRDYTATPNGALYGILKNRHKPAETQIATRTRIPNLFLTGQNVNLHGVLGVSITAIATCSELIGMHHLLQKINR